MKTLIIVPAYNEAAVVGDVVRAIHANFPKTDLLVIDDGSRDTTANEAKKAGAIVIRHVLNRGLGGAIGTGLAFAKQGDYDLAVTVDADGQHDPRDIERVLAPLIKGRADVVVGSRMISRRGTMPFDRQIMNTGANLITWLLFGVTTSDSQSGFRGFNKKAITSIFLRTERMEVSSEIFSEIKRLHLRYAEVPIRVIYTEYSRGKGQSNSNGLAILFKLVLRLFR